jgi:hypothetical protein
VALHSAGAAVALVAVERFARSPSLSTAFAQLPR